MVPAGQLRSIWTDVVRRLQATGSQLGVQVASPSQRPKVLRKDHGTKQTSQKEDIKGTLPRIDTDIVIVGAGFGGVYLMHRFRDELGFEVKCFEAGKDIGGVWHWNCYPGARVDSAIPVYEYAWPEVWKTWTWSCKYPGWAEIRRYFDHVDKQFHIKKDVIFNSAVVSSDFDRNTKKWTVKTEDGKVATCKYLIIATGFAAKRYFPDWPGLETFAGEMHHSSFWPEGGVDFSGKRVAVVGTGSTGIQITQEGAKTARELTVFQRTPNLCLPMRQRSVSEKEQQESKGSYDEYFRQRLTTFAGFNFDNLPKKTADDSPEEREKTFERLWQEGGFKLWLATYKDMLYDNEANRLHYDFWAEKVRARIRDPVKRDILAPLEPPHAFGTKRPSLESDFYEQVDKPNIHVVDIKKNPVVQVKPNGIITADGKLHEMDIIALATGFDSVTGGMKTMGLRDIEGIPLSEKWRTGVWTHLGMTCAGYPNMFFLYGAQAPTAFSNGPTCVEVQGDWIVDVITKMKEDGLGSIEATREAEVEWKKKVMELHDKTLLSGTDSWYLGANIPGKPREQLNYTGGLPKYRTELKECLDNGFRGFVVVGA